MQVFPTIAVELVMDSLKRWGMAVYHNLKHHYHHELGKKRNIIPSGEKGRTAFASSPRLR